jgi:hypothetical protein
MELFRLSWHELLKWPILMLIEETGERIFLPDQPFISIGRLSEVNGHPTNDIMLRLPDEHLTSQISRWHLELRRQPKGFVVHSLSDKPTHIDGRPMARGESHAITIGTKIRLSNFYPYPTPAHPERQRSLPDPPLTAIPLTFPLKTECFRLTKSVSFKTEKSMKAIRLYEE